MHKPLHLRHSAKAAAAAASVDAAPHEEGASTDLDTWWRRVERRILRAGTLVGRGEGRVGVVWRAGKRAWLERCGGPPVSSVREQACHAELG